MKAIEMKNKALTVGLAALLLTFLACSTSGTAGPSASPAANTTSSSTTTANTTSANAPQNESLDFTLVNATGYDIKALYIGASGTGDWDKQDELIKGKTFRNGDQLEIKFHPKATAERWDLMVSWADGSGNVEWLKLKLTEISKITLHYNKEKGETTASVD